MKIEQSPDMQMTYMRRVGPYGSENKVLMDRFKTWLDTHGLLNENTVILGIAQDNPSWVKPQKCRYDVGTIVPVPDILNDDPNILTGTVAGGSYAVIRLEHTAEAIQHTWHTMFDAISQSGLTVDNNRPILERYTPELINQHKCEICIPIK